MSQGQAHMYAQEARRLWLERRLYEAQSAAEKATQLDPENPIYHHTLGTIMLEVGDIHMAMEVLQRAERLLALRADLNPVLLGPLRYNQAQVHYRSGRLDQALACWAEAYAEFARENLTDYQRMCAQNASWGASEAGRVQEARTWLDSAEEHVRTTEDRYRQNLTAAYLAFAEGRLTDCIRMIEYLSSQPDTPDDVRSFGASLAAMAAARSGLEEAAKAMVAYAIEVAYRAGVDKRCWLFAAKADREVKQRFYREGAS